MKISGTYHEWSGKGLVCDTAGVVLSRVRGDRRVKDMNRGWKFWPKQQVDSDLWKQATDKDHDL
jgi:hypothetical protein